MTTVKTQAQLLAEVLTTVINAPGKTTATNLLAHIQNIIVTMFDTATIGGNLKITSATVITNITTETNWTTGEYAGSETGLIEGNYYCNDTTKIMYRYTGTVLYRWITNNFTI